MSELKFSKWTPDIFKNNGILYIYPYRIHKFISYLKSICAYGTLQLFT